MRSFVTPCRLLISALALLLLLPAAAAQPAHVEGVLQIKLTPTAQRQLALDAADQPTRTSVPALDQLNTRFNAAKMKRLFRPAGRHEARHAAYGLDRWYVIELSGPSSAEAAVSAYAASPAVEVAELRYEKELFGAPAADPSPAFTPDDPRYNEQWHYHNTGQTGGRVDADIDLPEAWEIEAGHPDVVVQVVDSGVDVDHPDLVEAFWVNPGEDLNGNGVFDNFPASEGGDLNGIDDDGNGYVDDLIGYNHADDVSIPNADASGSHGTHTAGTVAARSNNGVGVAGVAGGDGSPDSGARLMISQTFGNVNTDGFAEAIVYGADNGAVITSHSWGYTNPGAFEQAVLDAIDYFRAEAGSPDGPLDGGLVVVAAGNDGTDDEWYPGYYEPSLAVSALSHTDERALFNPTASSSFGEWVDVAAPGGDQYTNGVTSEGVLSTIIGGYAFYQGTSMAAPHVSGIAALVVSDEYRRGNVITDEQLWDRVASEMTTDDIDQFNPDYVGLLGVGRANALKALDAGDETPPDAVTDLAVGEVGSSFVELTWTAPGDDGDVGQAVAYDLRVSTAPITEGNFEDAQPVVNVPDPGPAGTPEQVYVGGLEANTTYYFALKTADFNNLSSLSNAVSTTTLAPPEIAVDPASLSASLQTGETETQALTVSNVATANSTLEYGVYADFISLPLPQNAGPRYRAAAPATTREGAKGTGAPRSPYFAVAGLTGQRATEWKRAQNRTPVVRLAPRGVRLNNIEERLLEEDFEGGTLPDGWSRETAGEGWMIGSDLSSDFFEIPDHTTYAASNDDGAGSANDGSDDYLVTPPLNLVGYTDAVLRFESFFTGAYGQLAFVEVSTDGGASWTVVSSPVPANEWAEVTVDLGDFAGRSNVLVAFHADDGGAWASGWAVDDVRIDGYVTDWLTVTPDSSSVPEGESQVHDATFDATDVGGGTYTVVLDILSNDPDQPVVSVPATMEVEGAPLFGGDLPDALDFGELFVNQTGTASFTLVNEGTEPLEVMLAVDDPSYTVTPDDVTIGPGDSQEVTVSFTGTAEGSYPATLTITTNDPSSGPITIALNAEVVPGPVMVVEPDALDVALEIGATATETITVSNEGDGPLEYEVNIQETTGLSASLSPADVAAPSNGGLVRAEMSAFGSASVYDGPGDPSVRPHAPGDPVYTLDDGSSENAIGLTNGGDVMWMNAFDAVDGAETIRSIYVTWGQAGETGISAGHPTRVFVYEDPNDDGDPSDAVLLTEAQTTVQNPHTDTFTMVPIPATEVDGVFFIAALYQNHAAGAFPAPLDQSSAPQGASWVAGTGTPGAFNVDDLTANALPPSNVDGLGFAGNWLLRAGTSGAANIGWLAVNPSEGTVEPGGADELEVSLDAAGLDVGTYTADVVISSNDPVNSPEVVEVTLEVTSAPYPFALDPDAIELTLETDDMATEQFTIANTTDDEQSFYIEIRGASGDGPNLAESLPEFKRRVLEKVMASLAAAAPKSAPSAGTDPNGGSIELPQTIVRLLQEVGVMAYGTSGSFNGAYNGNFVQFDLGEPSALQPIGPSPTIYAGDFPLGEEGFFYVIDENNAFMSVDVETGETTPIGTSVPVQGDSWTELATDPTDGTLFASTSEALHTINPATGEATLVGPFGVAGIMIAIAVDDDGNIYGHNIQDDSIYSIDPETGAATLIGPTGVDANFAQGMDFDPVTGQLYMAWYQGSGVGGLRVVDTETGATELVGPFQGDEITYLAIPSGGFLFMETDLLAGTLAPLGDVTLDLEIDATGMFAGTYTAEVVVVAEVPGEPEESILVTLTVLADPEATLDPTALDFGEVFVNGTETQTVTLTNTGRDVLNVGNVYIDGAGFLLDPEAETTFALDPNESREFEVTFAPTDVQAYTAALVVESDNPAGDVSTTLTGEGIPAPIVEISPDSLDLQAYVGQQFERTLTISNTGGNPLECSIVEEVIAQPTSLSAVFDALLLEEDFNDGIPSDWEVVDNAGEGLVWQLNSDFGDPNWTSGDGTAAAVNSDATAFVPYDTELRTPTMTANSDAMRLRFNANYRDLSTGAGDAFDVDVSTDGGASWSNLLSWNEDHGGFLAPPGEDVDLDLSEHVSTGDEFMIRWRYYTDAPEPWDWYVQLDDVQVLSSYEWLAFPDCDTIAPGESLEIPLSFDATGLAPGTYEVNLAINTNDPVNPEVVFPITLTVIESVTVTPGPEPEDEEVHPNEEFLLPLTVTSLDNLGVESFEFTLFFDETLLEPLGVETEGTLSEGTATAVNTEVPGQISVAVAEQDGASASSAVLFTIAPTDIEGDGSILLYVRFRAQEALGATELSFDGTFQFNEGEPPVTGGVGSVSVIPLYGDVSLNLEVSSLDASLVLQSVVGLTELNEAAEVAADVSGDGSISALDASLILRHVIGDPEVPCFPADPACDADADGAALAAKGAKEDDGADALESAAKASPRSSESDVAVGVLGWGEPEAVSATASQRPSGATESAEDFVRVPLMLTQTAGVRALELEVPFDPSAATVTAVTPTLPEGWLVTHNVVEGTLRIAMSGTTPLEAGAVATVTLQRHQPDAEVAIGGTARLNEAQAMSVTAASVTALPAEFALQGNYPNPFAGATRVSFDLPATAEVHVEIYDVLGRRVLEIEAGEMDAGARRTVSLEAASLSAGTYIYRVRAEMADGTKAATGRMTVVR